MTDQYAEEKRWVKLKDWGEKTEEKKQMRNDFVSSTFLAC